MTNRTGSWIAYIWSGLHLLAVSSLEIVTGSQGAQGARAKKNSRTLTKEPGKSLLSRTIGLQALEHIGGQLPHSQGSIQAAFFIFQVWTEHLLSVS